MNTTIETQNTAQPNSTEQTWSHKELWHKRGKSFNVEVSCHETPLSPISPELGIYRWCVYAYIYPAHPHFLTFDGTDYFFQDACAILPLHGGVIGNASYLRYHYTQDGKTSCIQVGADYNHLHDERFTRMSPNEANEVFFDAELLFQWLTDKESEAGSVSTVTESDSATRASSENPP